tara:strand:- start:2725 stop:3045 length:321 start_codon:yes stop_codon:yes gene_type:complete
MKPVEDRLKALEQQKEQLNDGNRIIESLSASVRKEVLQAIDAANGTTSVDERIQNLVSGLQSVLDVVVNYGNDFAKEMFVCETKISALEEVIDSYIDEAHEDLAEE